MNPSNKFNHRHKFERTVAKTVIAANVEFTTGALDEDFEDIGAAKEYALTPDVVLRYGCAELQVDHLPSLRLAE